jgi:outer membrane protein assembly factor BamD (BamD/ComL family)
VAVLAGATRKDASPTSFTAAQLEEFAQKRRALDEAQQLMDEGRYQEAIQRYDASLQNYPASSVARDARARAAAEMEKAATPKRRHRRRQDEDISPAELLRRLRKVFKP